MHVKIAYSPRNSAGTPEFCSNFARYPKIFRPFGPMYFDKYRKEPGPTTVLHIIRVTDFLLFYSNSARKCLILPAECSPQKSLILLEIPLAEFVQAYSMEMSHKFKRSC